MPPGLYTNPKRQRGSFPIARKDLRQTSLTLRVGVERDRRGQGRDAVDPRVWGRSPRPDPDRESVSASRRSAIAEELFAEYPCKVIAALNRLIGTVQG